MNLELKSLKVHKDLSEETLCFTAKLCLHGLPVADVRNHGQGGSHDLRPLDRKKFAQIEAWAKQEYPGDHEAIGSLVDDLLAAQNRLRQYRRWIRSGVFFQIAGDAPDSWRSVLFKEHPGATTAWLKADRCKAHGDQPMRFLDEQDLPALAFAETRVASRRDSDEPRPTTP